MSIKTVVFDFGNVLAFFSHRRGAEQLRHYAPPGVSADEILAYNRELEQSFDIGGFPPDEMLRRLRSKFHLSGSADDLAYAYADIFTPNDAVCDLVPGLAQRHRLLLLSNTNELHYRRFRRQLAATLDLFHALVTSHEVGFQKPEPAIYRHAEQLAGCRAEEMLFIDDLPPNVEAARACGWQGIVYQNNEDLLARLREAGVQLGGEPRARRSGFPA